MMETKSEYKMTELGKIPVEWEIYPLKELASSDKINSFIDGDWIESKDMSKEGIRIIQTGNIGIGRFIEKKAKRYISETTFEELNCKEIYEGDMLICRLADPIGRACLIPAKEERLITSVDITIFRPSKQYDSKYLVYYINSDENLSEVKKYTSGTTRQRISRGNLAKVLIKVPPLKEQQKIAEILSTVDDQIERTDQLIEKTKELKKGLMQQLLTKGIGHTEFKQSELGEIPDNWEVKRLSEVTSIINGGTPSKNNLDYWDDGDILWATPTDITKNKSKYISNTEQKITKKGLKESSASLLPIGSILMTSRATIGARSINKIPMTTNQGFKAFICGEEVYNEFLYYYVEILIPIFLAKAAGSTFLEISKKNTEEQLISLPSIEEQKQIASILSSVDEDIVGYEQEKSQYEELKKGLMQQLLTGKTRVKVD